MNSKTVKTHLLIINLHATVRYVSMPEYTIRDRIARLSKIMPCDTYLVRYKRTLSYIRLIRIRIRTIYNISPVNKSPKSQFKVSLGWGVYVFERGVSVVLYGYDFTKSHGKAVACLILRASNGRYPFQVPQLPIQGTNWTTYMFIYTKIKFRRDRLGRAVR